MTLFIEIVKQWAKTATTHEIIELREYFDTVSTNKDLEEEVYSVRKALGHLASIKHVKMRTGWDLKKSKDYVDSLY